MKNVNFRRAPQKTEGRAGGLLKRAVRRDAEKDRLDRRKGKPSGPPFSAAQFNLQPASMCSPLARPVVQPAGPSCATRLPLENSCFSIGNMALQPAGPPFSVIPGHFH